MAKQGEHNNDAHDYDKSPGPNKHKKSVVITTGSYKKPETYKEEEAHHENTNKQAQDDKNRWDEDTRDQQAIKNSIYERKLQAAKSSPRTPDEKHEDAGSVDHNASRYGQLQPEPWREDLNPDSLAGLNYGVEGPHPEKSPDVRTAYDVKKLHRRLHNLADDELKTIPIMPTGSRLEQGATYIDLRESEPHEFTAMGNMEAAPNNWYVPKSEVDYVLWNRLIGVHNPARLDEASA